MFLIREDVAYIANTRGMIFKLEFDGLKTIFCKKKLKNGKLTVEIEGKEVLVKEIIALLFLPDYDPKYPVKMLDGDETHCNIKNLYQPIGLKKEL